jgi:hypothetical protein
VRRTAAAGDERHLRRVRGKCRRRVLLRRRHRRQRRRQIHAGQPLSTPTGHGEGTRDALAYVHHAVEPRVRAKLEQIIPGRFSIVTHSIDRLRLQVLLDLPDIDSVYVDHVEITRKMLRHMLFPVWVQSIEKYADQRPRELLRDVAQGNDPANFVFALSKGDLVVNRDGMNAMTELSQDYAGRLMKVLQLPQPPRVFVTGQHELLQTQVRQLRDLLSRDRERQELEQSIELAGLRRKATLLDWLSTQDVAGRHVRAQQVLDDAQRVVNDRLLEPLCTQVLSRTRAAGQGSDRALAFEVAEEVARQTLWKWPLVNVVDTLMLPITSLVRANVGAAGVSTSAALLDQPHRTLAKQVQGAFAELRWINPASTVDADMPALTDDRSADAAAASLYDRVERALAARRETLVERCAPEEGWLSRIIKMPVRYGLTIGTLLWFPFAQPVMEVVLSQGGLFSWNQLATIVKLLGAGPLLTGLALVVVWVVILWAMLRFGVHRKVRRELARLDTSRSIEPSSVTGQIELWCDDLVMPWRTQAKKLESLSKQVEQARAA